MPNEIYIAEEGDTYERISRIKYGSEGFADLIRSANPHITILARGAIVSIPAVQQVAPVRVAAYSRADDDITISVSGKRFAFWSSMTLKLAMDSQASFEFSAPFEPDSEDFREIFRPLSFQPVAIDFAGELQFNGTLVNVMASLENSRRAVTVNGYALPGVLEDCVAPHSAYPVEYKNLNLLQIAAAAARPFGIGVELAGGGPGPIFAEPVSTDIGQAPAAFILKLAQQRSFVMSNTVDGALLLQRSTTSAPVANIEEGQGGVSSVEPRFESQKFFSHVTAVTALDWLGRGGQYTVENPHLRGVIRPHTFEAPDTYGGDGRAAAQAKAGRMFANAVQYEIEVAGHRAPNGDLWKPNTTVTVKAPSAMIYDPYTFLVRGVSFTRGESASTLLTLVVPGSFEGKIPERLPWD